MSSDSSRTGRSGRRRDQDGPRARFADLLPYLKQHRMLLGAAIALSLVVAAANLAQPALIGTVIERVGTNDDVIAPLVLLSVIVVAASLIGALQHYLLQRVGTAVVFTTRQMLVARLLRLPVHEFDARRRGDLVSRVSGDTTLLYAVLTRGLIDSVSGVLIIIGALVAMIIIDPILLLTIVGVFVLAAALVGVFFGGIRRASARQQEKVGEITSGVERAVGSIRTIRASGATEREERSIIDTATAAYRAGLDVARASAFVVPMAGLALQVSIIIVLGVGGFRLATGLTTPAALVTFVMFLFLLVVPLGNLIGAITSVGEALGALGRIEEIIELPSEESRDAPTAHDALIPLAQAPAVEFRDVSFRYAVAAPNDERRAVLRGVSFDVPQGARVALVGPSGAGKSTVLSLLERFYDPDSGTILVNGHDVAAVSRAATRAQFGYVEQDAPTLAGTLADNVRLASPDAADDACERVLRSVNLGAVLDRSAAGINTVVGESGVMLSGGERQRLAIARALLAAPPILLLDESTSSLDGRNEQLMRDAIATAASGRTLIVVAHRLATVVDSDQIIVLDAGEVVATGTHEQLVELSPLYRDLARRQLLIGAD